VFRWIIGSSLQFRFLVVAAAAALLAFGSQQLRKMPDIFATSSS
jgi:Cu/Ag efflux pump CusA